MSAPDHPAPRPLLRIRGLSKRFPGVRALDSVDFTLRRGEIHALMGENGAGKSTLIKVLTGVYEADSGSIELDGQSIHARSPQAAQRHGISTVYQEVNLIPTLSIAENIFLGRQPRTWRGVDWKAIRHGAEAALARLDLRLDVRQPLGAVSIAIQQMVAIARALDISAKALVLDEPTSSLDKQEVQRLFDVMRRLKGEGLGILFVTHFLDQVYEVSDTITVLRNGKLVGEFAAGELPRLELIGKMIGRELASTEIRNAAPGNTREATTDPFLVAKQLRRQGSIEAFDLEIRRGEAVGVAGLLGSGRTEMARLLFGLDRANGGEVQVGGRAVSLHSPRQAIALGIGFCPEDRKVEGIIPDLSVRENIILVLQAKRGWWRPLSRKRQAAIADEYIQALRIATSDAEKPIRFLSGGNQQKAILARWLATLPQLLILDEPTRGVDVGAKFEIARLMERLVQEGMALIFISSELEEVVRVSHRAVVLRDRQKIAELSGDAVTEERILNTIAAPSYG